MDLAAWANVCITLLFVFYAARTFYEMRRQSEMLQSPQVFLAIRDEGLLCREGAVTKNTPVVVNLANSAVAVLSARRIEEELETPIEFAPAPETKGPRATPVLIGAKESAFLAPCEKYWRPGLNHVRICFAYGPNAPLYRLDAWLEVSVERGEITFRLIRQGVCNEGEGGPTPHCKGRLLRLVESLWRLVRRPLTHRRYTC